MCVKQSDHTFNNMSILACLSTFGCGEELKKHSSVFSTEDWKQLKLKLAPAEVVLPTTTFSWMVGHFPCMDDRTAGMQVHYGLND